MLAFSVFNYEFFLIEIHLVLHLNYHCNKSVRHINRVSY